MTNELEKTFFDTFGIKPRQTCKVTSTCNNYVNYNDCNGCNSYKYPQISDRILLELIKLCLEYLYPYIDNVSLDEFKKDILETLIRYKDLYEHQVRTLFEEG